MVVDLIGIYGLKGPYCTLTTTNWFLQALSVIPRGSWGDVARRFTMIRWAVASPLLSPTSRRRRRPPCAAAARRRRKFVSGQLDEENPFVQNLSVLLVQADKGVSVLVVDRIGDFYRSLPRRADVIVTTVGARHKCQQGPYCTLTMTNWFLQALSVIPRGSWGDVANRWGDEVYGSYPLILKTSTLILTDQHNKARLKQIRAQYDKCVYATDKMSNTEHIQRCKAYTAASIITHAQSKAVKQAHIRTSSLLSYNYHKAVPSNTDLTPAKPNTDTSSGTVAQKLRIGSYELNQICPTLLTQHKALNERFTLASKSCTNRSVLARGVQRNHSYFNQSCLPSAIGEDKVR
ncbi:hypothetical protein F511_18143 [Dorcoceras hygrometricum]|uniref:Uncharacterized protein n=1 Tax=Dorcoceras hygrometricum TaxID=472368 RepID=A0A2Z7AAA0_9LAMI|nr:hypothetical protein F511_18143 [Dorcoceras hygrometricum]